MNAVFHDAMRTARNNRARRGFPNETDARVVDGLLFPIFQPKFPMRFPGSTVFTIGSCFARSIEEVLQPLGVNLPVMEFAVPKSEYRFRANGLLNEYGPGAMNQRILYALKDKDFPVETIVPVEGGGYIDLLLHSGDPVTMERALERRRQIDAIYQKLPSADLVIMTLGLIETWFDKETGLYLNQMPPRRMADEDPTRFELRRLDVFDVMRLMEEALAALTSRGMKVLLTVSPVPLNTTFMNRDAVVANEFSKSVLRVAAERLSSSRAKVDYFPSYEIVRSGGLKAFVGDHVHVRPEVVAQVARHMLDAYARADIEAGVLPVAAAE